MEENKKLKKRRINYIGKFWIIFGVFVVSIFTLFFGISNEWFGDMPSFTDLENPEISLATEVYSSDGILLGTYFIENRSNTNFNSISPNLINALIATEDIRFEEHSGVDGIALLRVAAGVIKYITTGKNKGGGSTLTQQLAKNLFPRIKNPSASDLIVAKLKEWITAIKLERNYTKQEIIAMYLNTVAFGSHSYGIKSAARTFFSTTPDSLNLQQAALMVGVVNAPTFYSPVRNPKRSLKRRNLVLSQMKRYGFIDEHTYDSVSKIPIDLSNYGIFDHTHGQAQYFREFLREQLKRWCSKNFKADGKPYDLYQDGLKIYTTIDSRIQKHAEEAVKEHLALNLQPSFYKHWENYPNAPFDFESESIEVEVRKLMMRTMRRTERYRKLRKAKVPMDSIKMIFDKTVPMKIFSWQGMIDTVMSPMDSLRYYKYFLHSGLMSIEPITGHVKAYVGGIDFNTFQYDHVTQGVRQVGSTFKPFLYTLAMQEGEYTPYSKLPNIQPMIELDNGDIWKPKNSPDGTEGKEITLKYALATSNNWISGHLIKRYSPQAVIKIARNMGVKSYINPVYSIALGSADLKLSEMVGAMNTFASKGVYVEPIYITHIKDKNGNEIARFSPERNEAMNEETAFLMLELMKGVIKYGTGRRLGWKYGFKHPIAGKTGTTNNQSDGWFMGIVPQLTTGVWVGCEDRSAHFRSLKLGQGANMSLPIWALFMTKLYADSTLNFTKKDFKPPLNDLNIKFNRDKYDSQNKESEECEEEEF
jgi:penicillin-binding protein 1A